MLIDPFGDLRLGLHRTLQRGQRLGRVDEAHVLAGFRMVDEADGEKEFDHGAAPLVRDPLQKRAGELGRHPPLFLAFVGEKLAVRQRGRKRRKTAIVIWTTLRCTNRTMVRAKC